MTFNSPCSQASCGLTHFYCLRWSEASCSPFQSIPCHEPSEWSWPSFPCQPLLRPGLVSSPWHWLPFSDLPLFLNFLKCSWGHSKPCKRWSHSFSSCSSPTLHPTPIPHPVYSLLNRSSKSVGNKPSVQFSHSVVSDSLWLHGLQHARLPCPSPTPRACSNSCPSNRWCYPTISSSVVTFCSCLQSSPASRSLPMNQFLVSDGQSTGVSASASVLPMTIQGWFPLRWTGLISLQSKGLSRVFSNTTAQKWTPIYP